MKWSEEEDVRKEGAGETKQERRRICLRNVQSSVNVHDELQINVHKQRIFPDLGTLFSRTITFTVLKHCMSVTHLLMYKMPFK